MKKVITIITVLVAALFSAPSGAEIVSNSKIVDGIEYYMQVDDSVYELGEDVEMLFRVTNLRIEPVTISCSRAPEFDFWVKKDEETVWTQIQGWYWFSPGVELFPGESTELTPYDWDKKDGYDNLVEPGIYDVLGVMYNEPWNYHNYGDYIPTEVGIQITIIPEPCSMFLLGFGALVSRFC